MIDAKRKEMLTDMGFSDRAIKILDQNLNMRKMENPSISEQHQGDCGDILFLSLKIEGDEILDAVYEYIGCAGLQSCASALTELVKGKSIEAANQIDTDDIIDFLGRIPEKKFECAEIARDTLRKAIHHWRNPALKVI